MVKMDLPREICVRAILEGLLWVSRADVMKAWK